MLSDVLIPLRTHPTPDSLEAAQKLLRLAATFATHATISPLEVVVPPVRHRWSSAFVGVGTASAEIERKSQEESRKLQALAEQSYGLQLVARPLRVPFGDPASSLTDAAHCHDVTMVGFSDGEVSAAMAEAAMFGTGRPVLLVPTDMAETTRPFARIALAWDGSSSASRALLDAMPLIRKADEVIVINAPDEKPIASTDTSGLRDYLIRHGVAPRFIAANTDVLGIGLALQQTAKAEGAGLLVMGAYGHSRLQQFILGGATRQVLENLQLPVLMSHS